AGFARATALNVVVAIDQVRDLLRTLRRTPRPPAEPALDPASRVAVMAGGGEPGVFPLGAPPPRGEGGGDAAPSYEIHRQEFPVHAEPLLVIEDRPSAGGDFGEPGDVYGGSARGLKRHAWTDLSADERTVLGHILDALRRASVAAVTLRT